MSCRVELIEESQDRQEQIKIGDKFRYKRIPTLVVVIKDIKKSLNKFSIEDETQYIQPTWVDIDRFKELYERV